MTIAGLAVTLAGFAISVGSLGLTSSNGGRLALTLVGIVVSLFGILGLLNPAYQKSAVWKG
jgi:hypothetical protein